MGTKEVKLDINFFFFFPFFSDGLVVYRARDVWAYFETGSKFVQFDLTHFKSK